MKVTSPRTLFLLFLIFLGSCDGNRVYEEFQDIPSQVWSINDSLVFQLPELEVSDKTGLLGIRFKESYSFTNFYVKLISQDSSGLILDEKLVNMVLFDPKSGKPQGKGFGDTFTSYDTLDFHFPPETKKITLLQYMREEQLSGIEAVGLKIIK